MANRYWVGGTASWDGTVGTKWAATSGGAGGASVPTSADDVFFDALSSGTVTIATGNTGAKSITCTGFTGTIAGSAAITVSGSVTLAAGMTYTSTSVITFAATGTLTTAGKTIGAIVVSGAGITLTLGGALTSSGSITITSGSFTTANFNVTATALVSSNSNVRTISLGSSTITLSLSGNAIDFGTITNLTFNAGTSQINLTAFGSAISVGTATFYNVSYTFNGGSASAFAIFGSCTFNNLTVVPPASSGRLQLRMSDNQVVNGTLTCAGVNAIRRVTIRSNGTGPSSTRTLTVANLSAADCDFRDITIAGAAAGSAPTRAGDCGGNTGLVFPASKTVYRVTADTNWSGSSSWATSSGGVGADSNFPLAQDVAVIDNNTPLTGSLNTGIFNISAIDSSTRTTAITIVFAVNENYGSIFFGSGVILSGANSQTFLGRGTMNFTSAGKTIPFPIVVQSTTGTFALLDALTSTQGITLTSGNIDLNGFTLTCTSFNGSGTSTRSLIFDGGTFVISGTGTGWTTATATALTISGTGTISMTNAASKPFQGGGANYSNITLNNGGAGAITVTGSNTLGGLSNTVQPTSFLFTAGTTTTIGTWAIAGTPGNLVTIGSITAASHTLSKTSGFARAKYISISRSIATGGATWQAYFSTDGLNNTGWTFSNTFLASRLTSIGNLLTNVNLDEVTSLGVGVASRTDINNLYAVEFDEVTLNPISAGLARRITSSGSYRIAGEFDEFTGIS